LISSPAKGAVLASHFGTDEANPSQPAHTVVLMRGHGYVTVAGTVPEAVLRAYYTMVNARIQYYAIGLADLGGSGVSDVRYLSAQERRDTGVVNAVYALRPWELWTREVETAPLYQNTLQGA
jgi:ribulose-5-phosphate 4-epimerase/fuculose-1-phosphate aldolase